MERISVPLSALTRFVVNVVQAGSARARTCLRLAHLTPMLVAAVTIGATSIPVHAAPVQYVMFVWGINATSTTPEWPGPLVTVGKNTYGALGKEVLVTFTFTGDTSNVNPYSVTASGYVTSGYEIRMGTASVEVQDWATNAVLYQGTFDPSAGIFVSVDNTNEGIGFGSKAVWPPTAPGFPGQPVYPLGLYLWFDPDILTYNLQTNFNSGLWGNTGTRGIIGGWSCVDFPNLPNLSCAAPLALPMTDGNTFTMNFLPTITSANPAGFANPVGYFETNVNPFIEFSYFNAKAVVLSKLQTFDVTGTFGLGTSSNGINPTTDSVTLTVNGYTATLPPGSFKRDKTGAFNFAGKINNKVLAMRITPRGSGTYQFTAAGTGSNLAGSPVSVMLTIGDNSGSATATPLQ